jgi:hypothetical protein
MLIVHKCTELLQQTQSTEALFISCLIFSCVQGNFFAQLSFLSFSHACFVSHTFMKALRSTLQSMYVVLLYVRSFTQSLLWSTNNCSKSLTRLLLRSRILALLFTKLSLLKSFLSHASRSP